MTPVTVYTSAGEIPVLASLDIGCGIPRGLSRSEREDYFDGCEIMLFTRKTERRIKSVENMLTKKQYDCIRQQMRSC